MEENETKKRRIEKENILNEIPVDLWTVIISYLNGQKDFLILIQVSKQLYETLCCPQILNQIIWKIESKPLKNLPDNIFPFCTPFEKKHFDYLKIDFVLNDVFSLRLDSLPKNLYSLTLFHNGFQKVLKFNSVKKGNKNLTGIFKELEQNTSLTHLDIRENLISFESAKYLEKALEQNISLKNLNIFSCNLLNPGIKHVMKGLEKNKTLRNLNIGENNINEEGAKSIGNLLEQNNTLEVLNLSMNKIKDEGFIHITKLLEQNNTLKDLNLSYINMRDIGMFSIAKVIENNKSLTNLNLSYNTIGISAKYIAKALKNNTTLKRLSIHKNNRFSPPKKLITKKLRYKLIHLYEN